MFYIVFERIFNFNVNTFSCCSTYELIAKSFSRVFYNGSQCCLFFFSENFRLEAGVRVVPRFAGVVCEVGS